MTNILPTIGTIIAAKDEDASRKLSHRAASNGPGKSLSAYGTKRPISKQSLRRTLILLQCSNPQFTSTHIREAPEDVYGD